MRIYMTLMGILGLIVLVLQFHGLLLGLTYGTLGMALIVAIMLANLFVTMVILLPAVLLAHKTLLGGAALGIASITLAILGPGLLRDTMRANQPMLQPPLAAVAGAPPQSVDLQVRSDGRPYKPCSGSRSSRLTSSWISR